MKSGTFIQVGLLHSVPKDFQQCVHTATLTMIATAELEANVINNDVLHARSVPGASRLLLLGIVFLSIGIAAFVFSALSTLAVAAFVGLVLIASGVVLLFESFTLHGAGPIFGSVVASLLSLAAGIFLLSNPEAGSALLTLMVGVTILLQGFIEFVIAGEYRKIGSEWVMVYSSFASLVIAVLIFAGWPANSRVVLGILLGIHFLTSGMAYIAVSRALQRSM